MTTLHKIFTVAALAMLILIGIIYVRLLPLEMPPLTYTYQFESCPFSVKFPGKPEIRVKGPTEQATIEGDELSIIVSCATPTNFNAKFNDPNFVEYYIDQTIKENGYQLTKKQDLVDSDSSLISQAYTGLITDSYTRFPVSGKFVATETAYVEITIIYFQKKLSAKDEKLFFDNLLIMN